MAVTSISQIYATDAKSLAYILDTMKTEAGRLTEFFMCGGTALQAAREFERTRRGGTGRHEVLAKHIIQSFKPGEVTPEQALAVGSQLAQTYLKGEYQYALGVHTDKRHVHVHVIFCNVSMRDGKTFETNENRGKNAWKKLREVSDKICKDHGLSVLDKTALERKGQSHYEWAQGPMSWKSKLKQAIDGAVTEAQNFEGLLQKLRAAGIACMYRPDLKIRLKFRYPGQQRWARAQTLGPAYDVEGLTDRIDRYRRWVGGETLTVGRSGLIDTTTDRMRSNEHLERWARVQNMKTMAEMMVTLEQEGIRSFAELESKIEASTASRKVHIERNETLKKEIAQLTELASHVEAYRQHKPAFQEHKDLLEKPFGKRKAEAFAALNAQELAAYKAAIKALKAYGYTAETLPSAQTLKTRIANIEQEMQRHESERARLEPSIRGYEKMLNAWRAYRPETERKKAQKHEEPEPVPEPPETKTERKRDYDDLDF